MHPVPLTTGMIKSSRIRLTGHVAHKEVMMNKYDVKISKPESYKLLWNLNASLYQRDKGRTAFHTE
jgi:hypothetical protein